MIENIPFNDDNIAGFRIDGRLTAEAYDGIRDVVDAKLARHQKLRIYVEIANDTRISAEAFFKDLKFALRRWDRFEREAVVTDQGWVQNVASIAGKLMPGIEVKTFATADTAAAKAWIIH
ncbi:MAG TPA: STAS/SEC14 domain-containing protein [Solimonas sp.]